VVVYDAFLFTCSRDDWRKVTVVRHSIKHHKNMEENKILAKILFYGFTRGKEKIN
jgi:hypothetical protein